MESADVFDLGTLAEDSLESAWLTVTHPVTGTPTSLRLHLASPDSAVYRKVGNRLRDRALKAMARRGKRTAESVDAEGLELLAGVTLGWERLVRHGEEVPFSEENARTLYERFPAIREQVDEFLADRRNFFRN